MTGHWPIYIQSFLIGSSQACNLWPNACTWYIHHADIYTFLPVEQPKRLMTWSDDWLEMIWRRCCNLVREYEPSVWPGFMQKDFTTMVSEVSTVTSCHLSEMVYRRELQMYSLQPVHKTLHCFSLKSSTTNFALNDLSPRIDIRRTVARVSEPHLSR